MKKSVQSSKIKLIQLETRVENSQDSSRQRSVTNAYSKQPLGQSNQQQAERCKISLKGRNPVTSTISVNQSAISKKSSTLIRQSPMKKQELSRSVSQNQKYSTAVKTKPSEQKSPKTNKIYIQSSSISVSNIINNESSLTSQASQSRLDIKKKNLGAKNFSKLGKIKIDLNNTSSKIQTQNILSSKKTLEERSVHSSYQLNDKKSEQIGKSRSSSTAKLIKPKLSIGSVKTPVQSQKKQSNNDILGPILPDFGSNDLSNSLILSDRRNMSILDQQSFKAPDGVDYPDINIELPEINFNSIKGVCNTSKEEFMLERAQLAQRIAISFRERKKIPPSTPDYYKVCYVIGRGAFAKVCLGVQLLSGQLVAMKIVEKSTLKTDNAKKRIVQEIMILKQLSQQEQIIKLYEVFETKKQIFIIMEYVEGGDLMKYVKDNGQILNEQQARPIFGQLLVIMQILQMNNILHRDIKLDNLLYNKTQLVKVCDFGVSRVIVKGQKILDQCGTPAYLAPEIIQIKGGYEGFASDIWSLGVALYIMVVGKVPFKGNSMNELSQSIQSGMINFMELKQAGVSTECMDLFKKFFNIQPKNRISLLEIIDHPWLKLDNNLHKQIRKQFDSVNCQIKKPSNNFDPKIINYIEQLGYQKEFIYKSLQKQSVCHINALYATLSQQKK